MDEATFRDFIQSIEVTGWSITCEGNAVVVRPDPLPYDANDPAVRLTSFEETLPVTAAWERDAIVRRVFAVLQFRTDHELREHFTVEGVRWFDAHKPVSLTGLQHDWFVEAESAVRGY